MGEGSGWVILVTVPPFESPTSFIRVFRRGLRWVCPACGQAQGYTELSVIKAGKGKEDTLVAHSERHWGTCSH